MGSIITATRKSRARVITQISALAFLNVHLLQLRSVCFPVLNCHSCPLAVFACPIGVLVNFASLRVFPFTTVGILGLVGILGGRLVCGWVCPFGLLQDGLHKIPTKKTSLSPKLAYTKYVLLIGLVFLVPFFWPRLPLTFCHLCPAGTLESAIPWAIMGVSSPWRFSFLLRVAILLALVILAIAVSRSFCRFVCPLGAILSLFNGFSLFRMRSTKHDCTDCDVCARECPVEIHPVHQINSAECVRCLDCTSTGHLALGIR